jgi:hypothetical protein
MSYFPKTHRNERTRLPLSWFFMVAAIVTVAVSLATSYDAPLRSNVKPTCYAPGC